MSFGGVHLAVLPATPPGGIFASLRHRSAGFPFHSNKLQGIAAKANKMTPWTNFAVLIVSSFLFTIFYVKSFSPAALEKRIGASAYRKCTIYRMVASITTQQISKPLIEYFSTLCFSLQVVSIEMGIFTALGEASHISNTSDLVNLKRRNEILHGAGACTKGIKSL